MSTVAEPATSQANGAASSSPRPSSPLSAASTGAKRKREASDDGSEDEEMDSSQIAAGDAEEIDERELIRDFFEVLQRSVQSPTSFQRTSLDLQPSWMCLSS
jgi:hypothetical protein